VNVFLEKVCKNGKETTSERQIVSSNPKTFISSCFSLKSKVILVCISRYLTNKEWREEWGGKKAG